MLDLRFPRLLLLLSVCAVREALCKSVPDQGAFEVQIKVQVFDNSDLSPLDAAQVEVHGNQSLLASSRAGSDGVVKVSFQYRTGTWVIITASKHDYVTNSVPWHSSRIPRARNQPLVQLQRKSIQLPSSSNYTALSASLTTARSQYELGGFPF